MTNIGTSNTNNSNVSEDQERMGERLTALHSEIVKDVERCKNLYHLNTMHENEASRDNLLAYLALRAAQLRRSSNGIGRKRSLLWVDLRDKF